MLNAPLLSRNGLDIPYMMDLLYFYIWKEFINIMDLRQDVIKFMVLLTLR